MPAAAECHCLLAAALAAAACLLLSVCPLGTQDMTYKKQLDAYENAVMKKRLEEMPESERDRLYAEIEAEKSKRQ